VADFQRSIGVTHWLVSMTEFNEIIKGHKTAAMITVLRSAVHEETPRNILVVGCGSGLEAGDIARAFGASTIGIDTCDQFSFDHSAAAPAKLMAMDARELEFSDASFDLVYSFHALEHIPTPARALAEMARILRPAEPTFWEHRISVVSLAMSGHQPH